MAEQTASNQLTVVQARANEIQKSLFSERTLEQLKAALPDIGVTPERLARIAFTAITKDPKLVSCSWQSLVRSVIQCAQYGLLPDGRQAHLVPYKNDCTLIIDYKGLVTLIRRSPSVSNMFAFTIHENDQYEVTLGTNPDIKHTLPKDGKDRGKAIAAYSVIRYKDGGFDFDIMSVSDVEAVRDKFAQTNQRGEFSKAWRQSFEEMMKKTVIRRHSKTADISYNVAEAIENDIKAEGVGFDDFLEGEFSDAGKTPAGFDDELQNFDQDLVAAFVTEVAKENDLTQDQVKAEAMEDIAAFKQALAAWISKRSIPAPESTPPQNKQAAPEPPAPPRDPAAKQEQQPAAKKTQPKKAPTTQTQPAKPQAQVDLERKLLSCCGRYMMTTDEMMAYKAFCESSLSVDDSGTPPSLADMANNFEQYLDLFQKSKQPADEADIPFPDEKPAENKGPIAERYGIKIPDSVKSESFIYPNVTGQIVHIYQEKGITFSEFIRYLQGTHKTDKIGEIRWGDLPSILKWIEDHK